MGYCLHKITAIFRSELNSAFKNKNIQSHHYAILSVIDSNGAEINQMKLCEELGIDKASMVKIIDHLENLEFIERIGSKADRRVKNLILTKKGTLFLQEGRTIRSNIESKLIESLSPAETEQFKKLLLKILDHQQSI